MGLRLQASVTHIMHSALILLATLTYTQAAMDQKAGQTLSPTFTCGKYTTRTVLIGANTVSVVKSQKGTMRCTVLFKLTDCAEMRMTCQKFYVDNRDPYYCKRDKPNDRYPAVSDGHMKMWYTAKGGKRYPKKGFSCTTVCSKASQILHVATLVIIQPVSIQPVPSTVPI